MEVEHNMATRIKLRRDTAANWTSNNPRLALGEPGVETDTRKMKVGDGATLWNDLDYMASTGDLSINTNTISGSNTFYDNWISVVTGKVDGILADMNADAVAIDSMGNIFMSGYYFGNTGAVLIKFDNSGAVIWQKKIVDNECYGRGMTVDGDDNLFLLLNGGGNTNSTAMKVNGDTGSIMWQKTFNNAGNTDDYGLVCDVDAAGNLFVGGYFVNTGDSEFDDMMIYKLNGTTGSLIWAKGYNQALTVDEKAAGIAVDADGNIIMAGSFYSNDLGSNRLVLLKISGSDGSVTWNRSMERTVTAKTDNYSDAPQGNYPASVVIDGVGNIYVNAAFSDRNATAAPSLFKFDNDGNIQWTKAIGFGSEFSSQYPGGIDVDNEGYVYFTGTVLVPRNYVSQSNNTYNYDAWKLLVAKFDGNGNCIWQRTLEREQGATHDSVNPDDFSDIWPSQLVQVMGDNLVLGGGTYTNGRSNSGPEFYYEAFVANLDRSGKEIKGLQGWTFKATSFQLESLGNLVEEDITINTNDPDLTSTNGDSTTTTGEDGVSLYPILQDKTAAIVLNDGELTVTGSISLSRPTKGYCASLGWFNGENESNNHGDVWSESTKHDADGNLFISAGWNNQQYGNEGNQPLLIKLDSTGKMQWQRVWETLADPNNDQEPLDLALNSQGNPVQLTTDGNEGFYVTTYNKDTGEVMEALHVTNTEENIYPNGLRLLSDDTPVVVGNLSNNRTYYRNVTDGGSGASGSGPYVLVVPRTVFDLGDSTLLSLPTWYNNWYVQDGTSQSWDAYVTDVNYYQNLETHPYQTGSGAVFSITTDGSGITGVVVSNGGSNFKTGNSILIAGTNFTGGSSPANDVTLIATTVVNGAITEVAWSGDVSGTTAGTFTSVTGTTNYGTGYVVDMRFLASNGDLIALNINANGSGYTIGDKVKVLGTDIGGTSPANDVIISIQGTYGSGSVNSHNNDNDAGITTYVKITTNYNYDFNQSGTYDIYQYTGGDAFIWTPMWNKVIGGNNSNYDTFTGVAIDSNDNIIATGKYQSNNDGHEGMVVKFNSSGATQWAKYIDGAEGYQRVTNAVVDSSDNVYTLSYFTYDDNPRITKMAANGDPQWQITMTDMECSNRGFAIDSDDNIYFGGDSYSGEGFVVGKLDKHGNQQWLRHIITGLNSDGNDGYWNGYLSDHLSVGPETYTLVGYGDYPGGQDSQAYIMNLPKDGSGIGNIGNWEYKEVQSRRDSLDINTNFMDDIEIAYKAQSFTTTTIAGPFLSDGVDRKIKIEPLKIGDAADIKGVSTFEFEDGTTQETSGQDIPQIPRGASLNYSYVISAKDRGKHIMKDGGVVVVPTHVMSPLPIGTVVTIVSMGSTVNITSYDSNTTRIRGVGDDSVSSSYTLETYGMVSLLKIDTDEWMLSGGVFGAN